MKGRFRLLFVFLVAMSFVMPGQAQDTSAESGAKGFDPNRLFFGGNFGLTFGDFTFINISPQVGYQINPYLAAGAGVNFIFSSDKVRDQFGNDFLKQSSGFAGLNVFARAFPVRFLFVSAQPELNYSWGKVKYYNPPSEINLDGQLVPSLLLGGGVAFPAGRGALLISAQYDVLHSDRTPYGSNIFFSFGYTF